MKTKNILYIFLGCLLTIILWAIYQQSQEITYLKDNQQIRNLVNKFTLPFDDFDLDAYKSNYLPSGSLLIVTKGKKLSPLTKDKMDSYFLPKHQAFKKIDGQYRHLITNINIINQTSELAFVKANLLLLKTIQHKKLTVMTSIRCEIYVKKINNRWFLERVTSYLDRDLDQH